MSTVIQLVGAMYNHMHNYWLIQCVNKISENNMDPGTLEWDQILSNCTENNEIEQGIFSSALTNKILTRNFVQKYMFCFSWGLKSLRYIPQLN